MNVLITGCSRGIGRGFLEKYLALSFVDKVWAVSTNRDKLRSLQEHYPNKLILVSTRVDEVTSKEVISSVLGNETLDLLINCAGAYPEESSQFTQISRDDLQMGFEANTYSAVFTTQACLPALLRSKSAKAISITSLMGSIEDNTSGGSYAYRMSKAALNMFKKCLAVGHPKITAVVLHPGWVKTDMGGDAAPTTIEESVDGMMNVISKLTLKDSSRFFDFEGEQIPW